MTQTSQRPTTIFTPNWLINSMFNNILKVRNVAIVLLSAFFFACDDPKDIGFDLSNSGNITPYYSDTLKVTTSTVLSDSAINANQNYVLTGNVQDPVFGGVKAKAYVQPALTTYSDQLTGQLKIAEFTKKDNTVADSILLWLSNTSGLCIGDTLPQTEYSIHRLKKSLTPGKYYNFNEAAEYESTPILSFSVNLATFKNKTGDSTRNYKVKLPMEIANELLALANTDAGKDRDKFNEAFKGFAIVPSANAKAVYGFNVGAGMSTIGLYYHAAGETTSTAYFFDFSGPRYSGIDFNRAGTKLADLKKGSDEISSDKTGGMTYIQSSSGIGTKIKLDGLKSLTGNYTVNKATLEFKLDSSQVHKLYPFNFYYTLSELDSRNQQKRVSNLPTYLTTTGSGFAGNAALMDSTYTVTFDITYFVHGLSQNKAKDNSLLILPAGLTANQTALISNDNLRRSVLRKPKLKLYYSK